MTEAPSYPAGWYPDPQNPALTRWWDGTRWSEARHPAPDVPAPASGPHVATGTVWIWLVVFLPLLSLGTLFLFDWSGYVQDVARVSTEPGVSSQSWMIDWTAGSLAVSLLGYVVVAAQIVFAYLDWRALRARGVDRPFHWAWIFFALIVSNGVYVIGRGVVLRRRTGGGLGPIWAWIGVTVLGWVIGIVFAIVLMNEVFTLLARDGVFAP